MATLTSASLQRIVRAMEQLKPLPTNVLRVMRALTDSQVSASTIANLISLDQALTANILRLANSAFMGYAAPNLSVHQAVVRVGSNASGPWCSAPAHPRHCALICPATK